MPKTMQKTWTAKPGEIERRWYLVDAEGKTLGRLATRIADTLRGKGKAEYTPHVDTGEYVIVVNAAKVRFTGKKMATKTYQSYSHYPGGLKEVTARQVLAKNPERILLEAVKRMVPRNRLGRKQMTKLKIYAGPGHPHQAQQPQEFKLES